MEACELLALEVRLDRIEAELAGELALHLRHFAAAHARGAPPPPAPAALLRPSTLAAARAAVAHPVLAERGLALVRLAAPLAIESDPAVAAARAAEPTWDALSALAAARDAAAAAVFGRRALDVLHRCHGSAAAGTAAAGTAAAGTAAVGMGAVGAGAVGAGAVGMGTVRADAVGMGTVRADAVGTAAVEMGAVGMGAVGAGVAGAGAAGAGAVAAALPPPIAGWFEPDGAVVDDGAVERTWQALQARHGVAGIVRFERAAGARPRAFVVEPGREVIVVVPAQLATPAERFAVLHELGHAVAALASPAGIPRVVDEATAAYVARAIERPADPWYSPLAAAARARRRALAGALDAIERALPALPPLPRLSERPPWALWHDPGAQAAYVAAERLADAIDAGPAGVVGVAPPAPWAFAAALAALRDPIDRLASVAYAI